MTLKIQTTIQRGDKFYVVSTVKPEFLAWNGRYETAVFASDAEGKISSFMDLAMVGYDNETDARIGHEKMCREFSPRVVSRGVELDITQDELDKLSDLYAESFLLGRGSDDDEGPTYH